jgi:hypothetical protein
MSKKPLMTRYHPTRRARMPKVCSGSNSALMPPSRKITPMAAWSHFQLGATNTIAISSTPASTRTKATTNPMAAAPVVSNDRRTSETISHRTPLTM